MILISKALEVSRCILFFRASSKMKENFSFGTGKFVPLAGYTSALLLGVVAILMVIESIERLMNPTQIDFMMAIFVAVIGLIVNLVSALILKDSHTHEDHEEDHDHHHTHDHNHESALMHVIADAFTSVLAITALLFGRYLGLNWADPIMGIVGAIVILKWGYGLCKNTAWELLDGHAKGVSTEKIKKLLETLEGVKLLDLHVWRLAPNAHACEIIIGTKELKGSDFYRVKIQDIVQIEHLVIEERKIT